MKPNSKFLRRLQAWMIGRYGQNDSLNRFLTYLTFLLLILNLFIHTLWLAVAVIVLISLTYWRLFSRKIYRQVRLNRAFERVWLPIMRPFRRLRYQVSQHWHYRFFHCAQCQQRIRVPRHHGRVQVTCPKCHHSFITRT